MKQKIEGGKKKTTPVTESFSEVRAYDNYSKACEAVYGNKKCDKVAIMSVISNGQLFNLCLDCAKTARLQIKLNK